jgi:dolichol-phosphate mannosyltransferase
LPLSVVIPARNEESCIASTVRALHARLVEEDLGHEIIVVDDGSTDGTAAALVPLAREVPTLRVVHRQPPGGFGLAVRAGLEEARGQAVAVYMADASDSPDDVARFYHAMKAHRVDCVFGSRFSPQSKLVDYPWPKLFLNRAGNRLISLLFRLPYDDVTNAFKMYSRETLQGLKPYLSPHYNLTVELPLKAIVRGYTYVVLPNDWHNRRTGESKLRIREMGSRYMFIILYCLLEKWLARGDYNKGTKP